MKKLLVFICMIGLYISASAQASVETVSYQKVDRQAVVNDIPFPEKTIMNAIDNKMVQMGYKGKSSKGFTVYKGVKMAELGNTEYDLYFSADRKSRRNKDNSTITLILSAGEDKFITEKNDAGLMNKAKNYLNGIHEMITAYDLELQITEQQDVLNKSDKKYNNLVDEGQGLEKKIKSIEKDIEDNKKDQETQKADIEKQKLILETLKGKRKQ